MNAGGQAADHPSWADQKSTFFGGSEEMVGEPLRDPAQALQAMRGLPDAREIVALVGEAHEHDLAPLDRAGIVHPVGAFAPDRLFAGATLRVSHFHAGGFFQRLHHANGEGPFLGIAQLHRSLERADGEFAIDRARRCIAADDRAVFVPNRQSRIENGLPGAVKALNHDLLVERDSALGHSRSERPLVRGNWLSGRRKPADVLAVQLRLYLGSLAAPDAFGRRIRELEAFLRRVTTPELDTAGLGLRLRYLAGGVRASARQVGGRILPERSGYYVGLRLVERYRDEHGVAQVVRASVAECAEADERAVGAHTA